MDSGYYGLTDKAIDLLNRRAVKRFEDAKDEAAQKGFDELNVLEVTRTLYDQLRKDNQDVFLELAQERYQEAEPEWRFLYQRHRAGGYLPGRLVRR